MSPIERYDVVVAGGGAAGVAAAVGAARTGARTLLVERYGFLGGMGTAAGVTNFCGLHANVHGDIRQVVHGVADELLVRMAALDGLSEPHLIFGRIHAQAYDMSAFKCAADALLAARGVRPTLLQPVWAVAGHALGAATALLGPKAAMACTAAIEDEIDAHYSEQLAALGDSDPELSESIARFQADEREHRDIALAAGAEATPAYPLLYSAITPGCRIAIELSKRI